MAKSKAEQDDFIMDIELGDGDLSDADVALMKAGYAAPGGNDEDAYAFRGPQGYQNAQAGSGGDDQSWAQWEKAKLGL